MQNYALLLFILNRLLFNSHEHLKGDCWTQMSSGYCMDGCLLLLLKYVNIFPLFDLDKENMYMYQVLVGRFGWSGKEKPFLHTHLYESRRNTAR